MSEAERTGLDHVVLPRRLPGLALLERILPPPPDNLLDAELSAFAASGDTVLDPWAGSGWTARRAIAHGMRAVSADPSPFAQLAAIAFLTAPEASVLDAAFAQLAGSKRVDVPLRQHLEELYASRCAACRRPVVVDQFIWPRDADAPGRKMYRCAACEAALGGPEDRVAPVDEPEEGDALGEGGGPPAPAPLAVDPPIAAIDGPRFASTVRPEPVPVAAADGLRASPQYLELRARFPVLDGRDDLVEELLELFTPRNLYALHAIGAKIDSEIRDSGTAAVMRLALAACLLPASRLNGYPGRVASLRITGGHVRRPASRHQREVNVWRAFEQAYRDVRSAVRPLPDDRHEAHFASEYGELGGMGAANVLWLRTRPGLVGQYLPPEGIDLVLGAPPAGSSIEDLSFEYLATGWILGREAAETLRLEPIFGAGGHPGGAEATVLRHGLASAAGALKPGGWCNLLLDDGSAERLLGAVMAGAAAGLELVDVIHRESSRSGDGLVLHLRKPSVEDRLRQAVAPSPLRLGGDARHPPHPRVV